MSVGISLSVALLVVFIAVPIAVSVLFARALSSATTVGPGGGRGHEGGSLPAMPADGTPR